jgi:hypothetical protein
MAIVVQLKELLMAALLTFSADGGACEEIFQKSGQKITHKNPLKISQKSEQKNFSKISTKKSDTCVLK